MSLTLQSGEVAFTGAAGATRFSSNDKNLLLLATVTASFTINAVDRRSSSQLVSDVETVLATVPANSTFILGHTVISGRRRSIGGDQIVVIGREVMQNAAGYFASTGTGVTCFASTIWYNIFISGTQLKVRVSYRFPSAARTTYAGATAQVRVLVGGFEF